MDIVSKLVSRMLNSRLLVLADRLCHDMEVGYRKQRGVSDGIFVLRRLLETWRSTTPADPLGNDNMYLLFVDLPKPLDSVPRDLPWN